MKKIIMALAIWGISCSCAMAQTTKCICPSAHKTTKVHKAPHVNYNASTSGIAKPHGASDTKAYQVCREEGGYYTCCIYKNTVTAAPRLTE